MNINVNNDNSQEKDQNSNDELIIQQDVKDRLYPHQVDGVQWLWKMHHHQFRGALLADDMGLGKTVQICVYLQCLVQRNSLRSCLIICPASVLAVWENTVREWSELPIITFHNVKDDEKQEIRRRIRENFSIILTTYGMMKRNLDYFSKMWSEPESLAIETEKKWDYVILDEGHKIKNGKSEMSKSVQLLLAHHRILLSGTPLQNNLGEMWNIMDWLCDHKLLGSRVNFKKLFVRPIENGQDKSASDEDQVYGEEMAKQLNEIIFGVTLRRNKTEVFKDARVPKISKKTEIVLWCRMNARQIAVYECFLKSDRVTKVLKTTLHALACLVVLQKITNHVMLLNRNERQNINNTVKDQISRGNNSTDFLPTAPIEFDSIFGDGDSDLDTGSDMSDSSETEHHVDRSPSSEDNTRNIMSGLTSAEKARVVTMSSSEYVKFIQERRALRIDKPKVKPKKPKKPKKKAMSITKLRSLLHTLSEQTLYAFGNKLEVLVPLVENLLDEGHRVLIFGRYLKMLFIVDECLHRKCIETTHYDGTMNMTQRVTALKTFEDSDCRVMLITIGAGGEGITITAADRIIILDPNWNPTVDDQAIDRAYRIGQTRNVIVYRLVTCGTIEEKMYARQVWKECVNKIVIENRKTMKHFNKGELKELFTLADTEHSTMRKNIAELQLQIDLPDDPAHMTFLRTLDIDGISEHTQLFSLSHDQVDHIVRYTVEKRVRNMHIREILRNDPFMGDGPHVVGRLSDEEENEENEEKKPRFSNSFDNIAIPERSTRSLLAAQNERQSSANLNAGGGLFFGNQAVMSGARNIPMLALTDDEALRRAAVSASMSPQLRKRTEAFRQALADYNAFARSVKNSGRPVTAALLKQMKDRYDIIVKEKEAIFRLKGIPSTQPSMKRDQSGWDRLFVEKKSQLSQPKMPSYLERLSTVRTVSAPDPKRQCTEDLVDLVSDSDSPLETFDSSDSTDSDIQELNSLAFFNTTGGNKSLADEYAQNNKKVGKKIVPRVMAAKTNPKSQIKKIEAIYQIPRAPIDEMTHPLTRRQAAIKDAASVETDPNVNVPLNENDSL